MQCLKLEWKFRQGLKSQWSKKKRYFSVAHLPPSSAASSSAFKCSEKQGSIELKNGLCLGFLKETVAWGFFFYCQPGHCGTASLQVWDENHGNRSHAKEIFSAPVSLTIVTVKLSRSRNLKAFLCRLFWQHRTSVTFHSAPSNHRSCA